MRSFRERRLARCMLACVAYVIAAPGCQRGRDSIGTTSAEGHYAETFGVNVSRPIGGTIASLVASGPDGRIRCGTSGSGSADACGEVSYAWSETVTLSATPDPGFRFVAWAADCAGTSPTCTLDTSESGADKWVAAVFEPTALYAGVYFRVTVTRPTGGTVTSADGRIRCGTAPDANACGPALYAWSGTATLRAVADDGYGFAGFGGDCTGMTCVLDTSASASDKTVAAAFTAAPAGAAMRVFVTSEVFAADLGGTAGADVRCQQLAAAAGLSGTYKAWLSVTGDGGPAARFTHSVAPYVLVDGTLVATNWADLVKGTIRSSIHLTETGGPPPGGTIAQYLGSQYSMPWTATTNEGLATDDGTDCSGWARVGPGFSVWGNASWLEYWSAYAGGGTDGCAKTAPLYCFEQPVPAPPLHFIGGSVEGQAFGLVLGTPGQPDLAVERQLDYQHHFMFTQPVPAGTPYDVFVVANPPGQSCTVSNGIGTVAGADVSGISVTCANDPAP